MRAFRDRSAFGAKADIHTDSAKAFPCGGFFGLPKRWHSASGTRSRRSGSEGVRRRNVSLTEACADFLDCCAFIKGRFFIAPRFPPTADDGRFTVS